MSQSHKAPPSSTVPAALASEVSDEQLVRRSVQGDPSALDALVRRHQPWIGRLALRMLWHPDDAREATQEILLRMVTHLGTFRAESAFKTWAYRIAVRHLLNCKRGRVEQLVHDFACYGDALDRIADDDLPDPSSLPTDVRLVVKEAELGCLLGMLLCLDREQRVLFVLGELFEASDAVCAEVLSLSRANVRQRLSRARRQLYGFVHGRCGLVNADNPCRCARKTKGFIRQGIVNPNRLLFVPEHVEQLESSRFERSQHLEEAVDAAHARLFRCSFEPSSTDVAQDLRRILETTELRSALELD